MTQFTLPVTAATTAILATFFVYLTLQVIYERLTKRIVLGDNQDYVTQKKIRGQGNAAEQIPVSLILLGFTETLQPGPLTLSVAGMLVAGRVLHGLYFAHHGLPWPLRTVGMTLTVFGQITAIAALTWHLLD